ncbi:hypothetical protein [Streptomyces nigrescens]
MLDHRGAAPRQLPAGHSCDPGSGHNPVQDHMEVLEDTGLVTDATLDDVASTVPK